MNKFTCFATTRKFYKTQKAVLIIYNKEQLFWAHSLSYVSDDKLLSDDTVKWIQTWAFKCNVLLLNKPMLEETFTGYCDFTSMNQGFCCQS